MRLLLRTALLVCTVLLTMTQAFAADVQTFVVLPFKINGPAAFNYLEKAIPPMIASRLYLRDNFQSVSDTMTASLAYPANEQAVSAVLKKTGAKYVIWGDVTIIGEEASLDMRARDAAGKEWRKGFKTRVNDLIATLQTTTDVINVEVFGREPTGNLAATAKPTNLMNPSLIRNETTQSSTYLNPQFRYQGEEGSRLRSQALPFASAGMSVADVTGDGKNDVLILEENTLMLYRWDNARLIEIGTFDLPASYDPLSVRTIDLDRDKVEEIVVAMVDPDTSRAMSLVLSARGGKFTEITDRVRGIFLSVARILPDLVPKLIGQHSDAQRIFSRRGIFEMQKQGNTIVQGAGLNLPKAANVFNFTWLPGKDSKEDRLVVLTDGELLLTFNAKGQELALSNETYSGSAVYIEEQTHMAGFGKNEDDILNQYFIPMRMEVVDLDKDGNWELLVNKPISVAAQFFDRYRFFPEGEIQSLTWDGIGLSLLWKTRRIKGSVIDFTMGDINNDGILDLIVCVNTHPGALSLKVRRTIILAYPLDLTAIDPNTPITIER